MLWFDKWFAKKCRQAWEQANKPSIDHTIYVNKPIPMTKASSLNSSGLELTVYGADGGTVLEFRQYDINRDRCDYSLHVIGQNENFEERIAQAITMEMLKRGLQK